MSKKEKWISLHQTYTDFFVEFTCIHVQQEGTAQAFTFTDSHPVDFMYMPQVETAKGKTWIGEDGVSTYKLDNCDTTAVPYMRDAPVQVFHYFILDI
jgi:hypothetical protein